MKVPIQRKIQHSSKVEMVLPWRSSLKRESGTHSSKRNPESFELNKHLYLAFAVKLLDTLDLILGDRWLTRAWILQEAFSAGSSMIILLNCKPDVDVGRLRWRRRYSSSRGLSIDLTRLNDCMVYAEQLFSVISRLSIFREFLGANKARIATILRRSS